MSLFEASRAKHPFAMTFSSVIYYVQFLSLLFDRWIEVFEVVKPA